MSMRASCHQPNQMIKKIDTEFSNNMNQAEHPAAAENESRVVDTPETPDTATAGDGKAAANRGRGRKLRTPFRRRRGDAAEGGARSEEHTSELQSLMRISYAVFCLKKKNTTTNKH